jgi:RNA-directed DNA polymerase
VACRKRDVEARGKPQRLLLDREVEEYGQRESPPQAAGVSYHAEYSAVGKAHHLGKGVTGVRSPHRKLLPDTVGSDTHTRTSLRGIANKARVDKHPRFRDRYRCLDTERWLTCWHDLQKDAASGVEPVRAEADAVKLHANIEAWAQRLKTKRDRAKLVRRCSIPQEHGTERPVGIPALEDTLVQLACAKLFTAIDAQDFRECSDGYRPGRGALDAVRDLTVALQYGRYGSVGAVDGKGFFDHWAHPGLLDRLRGRIDDRAFLRVIQKWLKAGVVEPEGQVVHPETGTPQGGTVSPVLAHAYVHDALDLWCTKVVKAHWRGEAW